MARLIDRSSRDNATELSRRKLNGEADRTPGSPAAGPTGTTPADRDALSQAPRALNAPPRRTTM